MIDTMPRALAATIIAVVPDGAHDDTTATLVEFARTASVRPIVVSLGDEPEPEIHHEDGATVISGLVPKYLNNAVASLRLSSLPSVGWWRSDHIAPLRDFALLVDRLVLDVTNPTEIWSRVEDLSSLTAISDLRWARLTRWRDLLAQFLDVPEIRTLQAPFERVETTGSDEHDAALLAGWLRARLPAGREMSFVHRHVSEARIERVSLAGSRLAATLQLLPNRTCVSADVLATDGSAMYSRVVPLGKQGVVSLLADELKIRSNDAAFEEAVREAIRS